MGTRLGKSKPPKDLDHLKPTCLFNLSGQWILEEACVTETLRFRQRTLWVATSRGDGTLKRRSSFSKIEGALYRHTMHIPSLLENLRISSLLLSVLETYCLRHHRDFLTVFLTLRVQRRVSLFA